MLCQHKVEIKMTSSCHNCYQNYRYKTSRTFRQKKIAASRLWRHNNREKNLSSHIKYDIRRGLEKYREMHPLTTKNRYEACKFDEYTRQCKRCENPFRTRARHSRICKNCNLRNF